MSNVVGEIAINVTADVGPLIRQIGRGTDALTGMQRMSAQVSGGLKRFGAATTDLGKKLSIVSAGIAAVTAASFALVKSAASAGNAIGDAAKAAGMSTTAFQEYRFALKEAAAMTDEDFASSVTKLNKTLGEARSGSTSAVKAFEAIGVSQSQLAESTFTTDQALAAFVAKMEATRDPALAAAMATDLFGKAGASLGAGLSGVPGQVKSLVDRARELGVVMGPDAVKAAGEFDQKMNELGAQFEALKIKVAGVLLPVLVDTLIPAIEDHVIPAIEAVVKAIGGWIKWFGELDPAVKAAVGIIVAAFAVGGPVLLAIGAVATALGGLVAVGGPIALVAAGIAGLSVLWPEFGTAASEAFGVLGGSVVGALELIGKLIAAIGTVEQAFVDMASAVGNFFTVTKEDMAGMDFGGASGLGFGSGSTGGLGIDPGGGNGGGGVGGSLGGQMIGASIVNGMVLGATSAMNEKRDALAAIFAQLPQIARETLGINSPSRVFAEIGNFMGQGMAQGIADSQALVGQAVAVMGQTAVTAADGTVSSILGSLSTLFNGSKKFAAAQALINAWTGASEALKLPVPQNLAAFAKVLATGMTAVKNIRSASPGGGGGGGAAAAGGGGAAAQVPVTTMNFTVQNDPFGYGERFARGLAQQMNDARRSGSQIIATVSSS